VPLSNITLSGDTGVAVPGERGWRQVPPSILFRDLRRLVSEAGLGWHEALLPFTRTVARVLGLSARKGALQDAADADLILLDEADNIAAVLARGRAVHDPKGVFKAV
jgi:beta-aspartyl-dipeptidase (metallo-type)